MSGKSREVLTRFPDVPVGPEGFEACVEWNKNIVAKVKKEKVAAYTKYPEGRVSTYYEDGTPFVTLMENMPTEAIVDFLNRGTGLRTIEERLHVTEESIAQLQDEERKFTEQLRKATILVKTIENEIKRRERAANFNLRNLPEVLGFFALSDGNSPMKIRTPAGTIATLDSVPHVRVPDTHEDWFHDKLCREVLHAKEWQWDFDHLPTTFLSGLTWGFLFDDNYGHNTIRVEYPSGACRNFPLSQLKPYLGA